MREGFNPLSSGKSLQRDPSRNADFRLFEFQSPLHRGSLFNTAAEKKAKADILFQSPLHRGSLFNRSKLERLREYSIRFNPLFIGEVSSTG